MCHESEPGATRSIAKWAACALFLLQAGVASAQATPSAVTPPVVVRHVDPIYPANELASSKHGDVNVLMTIDTEGHVSSAEVAASTDPDLDASALEAARQWQFTPAMRDGVAIPSRIRVPFHFAPPAPDPVVEPAASDLAVAGNTAHEPPRDPEEVHEALHETKASEPLGPEEVLVRGRRAPVSRGASDFDIRVGQLAIIPKANASDFLKLAPGIMLSNEGGEGHAEQVFLRGFDAREGQDIEFSVGGVPINESGNLHGNGYADTHFIIPELVESLRVVEGPFDPRQGNYAVAGSANYELGLDKRGLTAKGTYGSWGTKRLVLTWGPEETTRHTFAGVEAFETDGFGRNRDATRASAMAQYEGKLGGAGSYRILATAYAAQYHSAGVIRADDYKNGRIGFYDSYAQPAFTNEKIAGGGNSSRFSLSWDMDAKYGAVPLTNQIYLIKRGLRSLENFTGFLEDTQDPLQSIHAQRGDMSDLSVDEWTIGSRGSSRFEATVFTQKQTLEFGYFARLDLVKASQQRLQASDGVPYKTEADLDSTLTDIGLYADANIQFQPWLHLRGGPRIDVFSFDINNKCAAKYKGEHLNPNNLPIDASCLTQQDQGRPREANQRLTTSSVALMPRASLIVGPFANVTFSASYGQGVRSLDPIAITQDIKTPFARIHAYEGGASYAHDIRDVSIVARTVAFQTYVDRDIMFDEKQGRNVVGVGTTRTGWLGSIRAIGSFFDESINLTFVRSTYNDSNLLVAYVPDVVLRSDTAFFKELPWSVAGRRPRVALGTGITYVGPRALPLGQRSQNIVTVDAQTTLTWWHYEIGLTATNIFNRQYRLGEYNFASDFHSQPQPTLVPERHFTAGAPRGIFATLAINLGGS